MHSEDEIPFDYQNKIKLYSKIIKDHSFSNYRVTDGLGIEGKEHGTKALKLNGKGYYKDAKEMILDFARSENMLRVSNGGKGGEGKTVVTFKGKEKEVDRTGSAALENLLEK